MNPPPETPNHTKLAQDKAAWDAQQNEKKKMTAAVQGIVNKIVTLLFITMITLAPTPAKSGEAKLYGLGKEQAALLQIMIQEYGYTCDKINEATKGASYSVVCNNYKFWYTVTDAGGKWQVKPK